MKVSEFNYELPPELIAQEPPRERSASRMLRLARGSGVLQDGQFSEFPDILRSDDLLVFNDTRVFPARLFGHRSGAQAQPLSPHNPASKEFLTGKVEVLLIKQTSQDPNEWECLVRPGRKIGIGEKLNFGENNGLEAEVIARGSFGERTIRFVPADSFWSRLENIGHVPLPPYIDRTDQSSDRERYQTVYAKERGSVAAPTAGLHFSEQIIDCIKARRIEIAFITLHVGLGTFQPVRAEDVEQHTLHEETYSISNVAAKAINEARRQKRRIVAVGTTTVRALEHSGRLNNVNAGTAQANLFIYPGFNFKVTGAILTNFHLPQSSLLMLISAFGGTEHVMRAYRHAVEGKYRFYSYGDCMFVE